MNSSGLRSRFCTGFRCSARSRCSSCLKKPTGRGDAKSYGRLFSGGRDSGTESRRGPLYALTRAVKVSSTFVPSFADAVKNGTPSTFARFSPSALDTAPGCACKSHFVARRPRSGGLFEVPSWKCWLIMFMNMSSLSNDLRDSTLYVRANAEESGRKDLSGAWPGPSSLDTK